MKQYYEHLIRHRTNNPDRFAIDTPEIDQLLADVPDKKRFSEIIPASMQGQMFARNYSSQPVNTQDKPEETNPLRRRFETWNGAGIHKWDHYLDAYWKHLQHFADKEVNLLEIGIYSGGSLKLWREVLGEKCTVHGVDIEPECRKFEDAHTSIHIGDQGDRGFWQNLKTRVPKFDIIIDDGGHFPHQQRISLEELLPHLNPGGIYICEDIHHNHNSFLAYTTGLVSELFYMNVEPGEQLKSTMSDFQATVASISYYPFLMVLQTASNHRQSLVAVKKGDRWEQFDPRGLKGR